ncbi:hypothetical protein GCM10023166_18520 [Paeniglutamicibacter cryotolerans]|uniref:Uncharacterized protein n=1 Tax=Paeniglutamicibacter cryotolerans TaxID=670079 RepID=A0A839QX56_9MICC|nr:hypothetical protein [Paeniglutamicibacter cryotolerans]MBB2996571.1 hypothetical protein [Paeniglutamicibacter cryotolerans]
MLGYLAGTVEDIRLLPGEYFLREGNGCVLFVVIEGLVEVTQGGQWRGTGDRDPQGGAVLRRSADDAEPQLPGQRMRGGGGSRDQAGCDCVLHAGGHGNLASMQVLASERPEVETRVFGP